MRVVCVRGATGNLTPLYLARPACVCAQLGAPVGAPGAFVKLKYKPTTYWPHLRSLREEYMIYDGRYIDSLTEIESLTDVTSREAMFTSWISEWGFSGRHAITINPNHQGWSIYHKNKTIGLITVTTQQDISASQMEEYMNAHRPLIIVNLGEFNNGDYVTQETRARHVHNIITRKNLKTPKKLYFD